MAQAVKSIKEDLGSDAVIISTKKVRQKGWLKFFKPRRLEVTAAVDEKVVEIVRESKTKKEEKHEPVAKEIAEVKAMLRQMADKAENGSFDFDQDEKRLYDSLLEIEVQEDIAKGLMLAIKEKCAKDHPQRDEQLKVALKTEIAQQLAPLYPKRGHDKGVIAFIGPTGVGKTTTLAKLAAQYALFHKKKVGLITIDTYRIGAVEQLKTYGEIIGMAVDVVMTPQELRTTIERHNDKEIILIDTAGRSSKNTMQVLELKGFLETIESIETYLVLSSTTKSKDIDKIVEDFKQVGFNKIIFTKIDETSSLGCILNVIVNTNTPVAYITDGQNVPDDIQLLYPKKVAKLLLKGVEQK